MGNEWRQWEQVNKYVSCGHSLYRASAPNYNGKDNTQKLTPTAVKYLKDKAIDSIISFNEYSYTTTEKKLLVDASISYLHLPVKDFTTPTLAQLKQAIAFFNDLKNHSTLTHCGYGHGRTGTGVTALQLDAMWGVSPIESEWKKANHVETPEQMAVLKKLRDELKRS